MAAPWMILVDINIPLRLAQIGSPHRQPALDALRMLTLRDQAVFVIAPQSLCPKRAEGTKE